MNLPPKFPQGLFSLLEVNSTLQRNTRNPLTMNLCYVVWTDLLELVKTTNTHLANVETYFLPENSSLNAVNLTADLSLSLRSPRHF
jgi:hypothetical protein